MYVNFHWQTQGIMSCHQYVPPNTLHLQQFNLHQKPLYSGNWGVGENCIASVLQMQNATLDTVKSKILAGRAMNLFWTAVNFGVFAC